MARSAARSFRLYPREPLPRRKESSELAFQSPGRTYLHYARNPPESAGDFLEEEFVLRGRIVLRGEADISRVYGRWIVTEIDVGHREEGAEHEAGASEKHDGKADFDYDEPGAEFAVATPGGGAHPSSMRSSGPTNFRQLAPLPI
jgi:hypothetical protein